MRELTGPERTAGLVSAMRWEGLLRANPDVRAQRFIDRWQSLKNQHEDLSGQRHAAQRKRIRTDIRSLANEIRRDPQAQAIMRARSEELGLRIWRNQSLATAMDRHFSRGRGYSRGYGLGR